MLNLSKFVSLEDMKPITVKVNNIMQKGYTYKLTEPVGKNFHPDFKPQLTPKEMMRLGIMEGKYFNDVKDTDEYPKSWFYHTELTGVENPPNPELSYYGIEAGTDLAYWKSKGWINKQDPRGWIEWYFRYYNGRRSDDDDRQIGRWKKAERFLKSARSYHKKHKKHSLKLLQSALHWAYDPRSVLDLKKDD